MIKNIFKYTFSLILLGLMFVACKDDADSVSSEGVEINVSELLFSENGGSEPVSITTNDQWIVNADASWLQVKPANGNGSSEFVVLADSSVLAEPRSTTVSVMGKKGSMKQFEVVQNGYLLGVFPETRDTTILYCTTLNERHLDLELVTNVKFTPEINCKGMGEGEKPWLTFEKKNLNFDLEYGERPRVFTLRLDWGVNVKPEERVAEVRFKINKTEDPGKYAEDVVITVKQEGAPVITDDRAGDSLALQLINERINSMYVWDGSENMQYWDNVVLWKTTDKAAINKFLEANRDKEYYQNVKWQDVVGRVRKVKFAMFNFNEPLPYEIINLKFVEDLEFASNTNTMLKKLDLGEDVCTMSQLKRLGLSSYGIISMPQSVSNLKNLETLDLSSNNFNKEIFDVVNKTTFPKLKSLQLNAIRRNLYGLNLSTADKEDIGLHLNLDEEEDFGRFMDLLAWELDTLSMSYCCLEGKFPSDQDILKYNEAHPDKAFKVLTSADITAANNEKATKDSLSVKLEGKPFVLPTTMAFSVNLNFMRANFAHTDVTVEEITTEGDETGFDTYYWLLYHPHLFDWNPYTFIFTQESKAFDSNNNSVGFKNEPQDLIYYYEHYPSKKPTIEW